MDSGGRKSDSGCVGNWFFRYNNNIYWFLGFFRFRSPSMSHHSLMNIPIRIFSYHIVCMHLLPPCEYWTLDPNPPLSVVFAFRHFLWNYVSTRWVVVACFFIFDICCWEELDGVDVVGWWWGYDALLAFFLFDVLGGRGVWRGVNGNWETVSLSGLICIEKRCNRASASERTLTE